MTSFDDQSASLSGSQPGSRPGSNRGSSPGSKSGSGPDARPLGPQAADGSTGRLTPPDDATVISAAARGGGSSAEIGLRLQGTMLGPYRLDSFIGGGGMGAVFRALDTTLDRTVAVKVLAGGQADDEEMLRRFRNEAQSAARLDHENIGRVFAVGSDDGWHYIVFEFIEGRNLRDLVREQGPFDLGRTVDIAIQVADALEHASQREVVHRDIKPSNIVITPAGKARIVDMGLARLHPLDGERDLTVSGVTLGTFDYISPEQARDSRTADVRSDLYSLGCTMFFMLAGRPPFAEGSMVQKLLQHQQEPPPPIDSVRADVPRAFAVILGRLMEKNPADRYQRPADLVADLVAFADAHGHAVTTARVPSAPVARRPTRRAAQLPWLVPVVGFAATVGGLWYQAAASRGRPAVDPAAESARDDPAAQEEPEQRVLRVGQAVADAPADTATTAAEFVTALDRAGPGDVIELAFSGPLDVPGFSVVGRAVELRAAAGARPVLRIVSPVAAGPGLQAACDVGSGRLTLAGVGMRLADEGVADSRPALFVITSGSLSCVDAMLVMPGSPEAEATVAPEAAPAFVVVRPVEGDAPGGVASSRLHESGPRCSVSLIRTEAWGDAVFLDASGLTRGRVDLSWSGGGIVSPRPLLASDGADAGAAGLRIDAALADAVFACRNGLVSFHDSPARPGQTAAGISARNSVFLLDEAPLVTQAGIGEPAAYESALTWRDQGSRYEGSDVLRRIDGAAERLETFFRDHVSADRHRPRAAAWPDAGAWEAGWTGRGK